MMIKTGKDKNVLWLLLQVIRGASVILHVQSHPTNWSSGSKLMQNRFRNVPTSEPSPTYEPLSNETTDSIIKEGEDGDKATKENTNLKPAVSGSTAQEKPKINGFRRSLSWVASKSPLRGSHPYLCADAYVDTIKDKPLSRRSSMETTRDTSALVLGESKCGKVENEILHPREILVEHDYSMTSKPAIANSYPSDEYAVPVSNSKPPVLQKSFSTDILPLFSGRERDLDKAIHRSRLSSLQRMVQLVPDRNRKRDELSGVFRNLDGAFLKYGWQIN